MDMNENNHMGGQKIAVELTNEQWEKLTTFLLVSTQFRKGELEAWEERVRSFGGEVCPALESAEANAQFWREMNETIPALRKDIEGQINEFWMEEGRIDAVLADANARASGKARGETLLEQEKG